MRNITISGSNIYISPKITNEQLLNRLKNLQNVYLVVNSANSDHTVVCLLNDPIKEKEEIEKTRNLLPNLLTL